MPRVDFALHFALLVWVAVLYVTVLRHFDLPAYLSPADLLVFAKEGALHALTLVVAVGPPRALARRVLFVIAGALLAGAAAQAGMALAGMLNRLVHDAGHEFGTRGDDTLAITVTAAIGAAAYGYLARAVWLPRLGRGAPLQIALACTVAMLAMAAGFERPEEHLEWFVVLWWFTFSGGLWRVCRLRPRADGQLRADRP